MQDTRQCMERVGQLTKRLEMWARHGDDAGSCEPGDKKAKEKLCTAKPNDCYREAAGRRVESQRLPQTVMMQQHGMENIEQAESRQRAVTGSGWGSMTEEGQRWVKPGQG